MSNTEEKPSEPNPPSVGSRNRRERLFLRGFAIVLLLIGLLLAWPLRSPIVFAIVTALLLHRPFAWASKHMPKKLAAAWILLLVALMIFGPLLLVGLLVSQEMVGMAAALQDDGLRSRLRDAAMDLGMSSSTASTIVDQSMERAAAALGEMLVPALQGLFAVVLAFVVYFILVYFLLLDGAAFVQFLHRMTPMPALRRERLLQICADRTHALVFGTVAASVLQGVIAGVGWWLLGMPAPFFWGFVMLVLSVIPVVGAFIVLLPGAAWAFMQGDVWTGVGLLVLNFVLVGLIDDLVRPYLIGRRSRVHTALILIGLLGGVLVFGISGLVLGPLILGLLPPFLQAWMEPGEGSLDQPMPEAEG